MIWDQHQAVWQAQVNIGHKCIDVQLVPLLHVFPPFPGLNTV